MNDFCEIIRSFIPNTPGYGYDALDTLKGLSHGLQEDLWIKGCHDKGYDYFDLEDDENLRQLNHLCSLILRHRPFGGFFVDSFRLLRMTEGCVVSPHKDPTDEGTVYSLNALIEPPDMGGILHVFSQEIHLTPGDAAIYCASEETHEITRVSQGTLYMLSAQVRTEA